MPAGPPVTSSLIRCGQNLKGVQDTYVRDDIYSGEFCSRVCAHYDTSDPEFGTLPARFNPDIYPQGSIDYTELVPGYDYYKEDAPRFLGCIPYLVAAVVYHHSWLEANLPNNNEFFSSRYYNAGWSDIDNRRGNSLRKEKGILLGSMLCPNTNMRATGVPLHISQNHTTKVLAGEVVVLKETVVGLYKAETKLREDTYSLLAEIR